MAICLDEAKAAFRAAWEGGRVVACGFPQPGLYPPSLCRTLNIAARASKSVARSPGRDLPRRWGSLFIFAAACSRRGQSPNGAVADSLDEAKAGFSGGGGGGRVVRSREKRTRNARADYVC